MENIIPYIELKKRGSSYILQYMNADFSSKESLNSGICGEALFTRTARNLFGKCGTVACDTDSAKVIQEFCSSYTLTCPKFSYITDFKDYEEKYLNPIREQGKLQKYKVLPYVSSSLATNLNFSLLKELLLNQHEKKDECFCALCELIPTGEYALAVYNNSNFCELYTIKELSEMFCNVTNRFGEPLINLSYFYDKNGVFKLSDSYLKSHPSKNRSSEYHDL